MDFRLHADGRLYVLEANANPNLSVQEDFARSGSSAGVDYGELLSRILSRGLAYRAEWRRAID